MPRAWQPREHRRAKTDRLDNEQLKRAFLGWLRGEQDHCKMCAITTFAVPLASARPSLVSKPPLSIVSRRPWLGIRSFNPADKTTRNWVGWRPFREPVTLYWPAGAVVRL